LSWVLHFAHTAISEDYSDIPSGLEGMQTGGPRGGKEQILKKTF
jgi:hypothetical protein